MFKYFKKNHTVQAFCPNCQENIMFQIPENLFDEDQIEYPFTFRYIHGDPPHSISLYIDKEDNIRGHEFGDSIQLSDEFIDDLIEENDLEKEKNSAIILESIFDNYSVVIKAKIPDVDKIIKKTGDTLKFQFESLFKSQDHVYWGDKIVNIRKKGAAYIISDSEGDIFEYNINTKKRRNFNHSNNRSLKTQKKWNRVVSKDGNVGFDSKNIYVGINYSGESVLISHVGEKYVVYHGNTIVKEQNVEDTVNKKITYI